MDLYQGLVGAGSWKDDNDNYIPKILVYDLENDREILNQEFSEVGSIYTFKFIPNTDYAVIAGDKGIRIINYHSDQIKWTGVDSGIRKAVSLSPNGEEIAFTEEKSDKIYFLDISDLDNMDPDQEPIGRRVLDENGNPTGLPKNWRLSYTPDGKYLVINSIGRYTLTIIDRHSMKIVRQYNFGNKAIAIDQKGNIITTSRSEAQLAYID